MPLRVQCRCGQELIVRYSEWVYAILGLVILVSLVNIAAVVVVFRDIHEIDSRLRGLQSGRPDDSARTPVASRSARPGAFAASEGLPGREAADGAGGARSGMGTRASPPPISPSDSERLADGDRARTEELRRAFGDPDRSEREGEASAAVARLLEQLHLLPSTGANAKEAHSPEPLPAAEPTPLPRPLLGLPKLPRALLLTRAIRDRSPVLAALLLDPDLRLRELALSSLESLALPPGALEAVAPLIVRARALTTDDENRDRLEAFAPASDPSPDAFERSWNDAIARAKTLAARPPSLEDWAANIGAAGDRGLDLLLLVDVTRSMDGALAAVQDAASWLLPALAWGLPSARSGLVLYRDDVLTTTGFSSQPERDVLPVLLGARAEGGGDVPEGVREAVEAGLALGPFAWREDASKHLIVIGDQPPRYEDVRALESLALSAQKDGAYHLHLLGITADESEPVPFFARFAKAGGGHHASGLAADVGRKAIACIFSESDPEITTELRATFAKLFGTPLEN